MREARSWALGVAFLAFGCDASVDDRATAGAGASGSGAGATGTRGYVFRYSWFSAGP